MTPAEFEVISDLVNQLADAAWRARGELVAVASQRLSCSRANIYRLLQKVQWPNGRKRRSDAGKTMIAADYALQVAGLIETGRRDNGKRTMTLDHALEVLAAQGIGLVDAATGEVRAASRHAMAAAMERYRCHPRQLAAPAAHRPLRSAHANHVWQIDASVCILFYLSDRGLSDMSEAEYYKNKPQNLTRIQRDRVIRYVVTDHTSGALYLEYVRGSESTDNLIQAFLNATQKRGHDDPLHGVPAILMMDRGAANTSAPFLGLLDRLGVRAMPHATGAANVTGQVEKTHHIIEQRFEAKLRATTISSFAELNAKATLWRTHFNATATHGRHGMTRNNCWLTAIGQHLRLAPPLDLCRELVNSKPAERTVSGSLTVSFSTKALGSYDYDLSRILPALYPGAKVVITVNPYRAPAVDVHVLDANNAIVIHTVEPIIYDAMGFRPDAPLIGESYRALTENPVDEVRKHINQAAYGVDTDLDVAKARKARKPAYDGKIDMFADVKPAPDYIHALGKASEVTIADRFTQPLSPIEAALLLKQRLRERYPMNTVARLDERYPNGVPRDDIDAIAAWLAPALRIAGGQE